LNKNNIAAFFATGPTDITNAGGNWVDQEVVVDGNIVTSRKPDDIPAFNERMLSLLAERQPALSRK
jgi:protease I